MIYIRRLVKITFVVRQVANPEITYQEKYNIDFRRLSAKIATKNTVVLVLSPGHILY